MTKVWVPIDLPEGCYITEVQGWSNVDQCAVVLDYGTCGTEPYAEPAPQREQWEYSVIARDTEQTAPILDQLGNAGIQGWELVNVGPVLASGRQEYWLRRRLP